jgi:hypothetical protein
MESALAGTIPNGPSRDPPADAIDGIPAALESRPAEPEKSAQRGRLAQQH